MGPEALVFVCLYLVFSCVLSSLSRQPVVLVSDSDSRDPVEAQGRVRIGVEKFKNLYVFAFAIWIFISSVFAFVNFNYFNIIEFIGYGFFIIIFSILHEGGFLFVSRRYGIIVSQQVLREELREITLMGRQKARVRQYALYYLCSLALLINLLFGFPKVINGIFVYGYHYRDIIGTVSLGPLDDFYFSDSFGYFLQLVILGLLLVVRLKIVVNMSLFEALDSRNLLPEGREIQ